MVLVSLLLVSTVKLPQFPPIGFRSAKGLAGLALHVTILVCALRFPEYFLFPLGLTYVLFGVARALVLGLLERTEGPAIPDDAVEETDRRTSPRLMGLRRRATDIPPQEKAE